MHQSRHIMIDASNKRLIEVMSPALQGEVAYKVNKVWLERVAFLRGTEPAFMVALALELTPMVFAPGEEPMEGYLYIVHRGLALYAGRVLSAGKVWGEDMILSRAELRSVHCAKAMNYLEVRGGRESDSRPPRPSEPCDARLPLWTATWNATAAWPSNGVCARRACARRVCMAWRAVPRRCT